MEYKSSRISKDLRDHKNLDNIITECDYLAILRTLRILQIF